MSDEQNLEYLESALRKPVEDPVAYGRDLDAMLTYGSTGQLSEWNLGRETQGTRLGELLEDLRAHGNHKQIGIVKSWIATGAGRPWALYLLKLFNRDVGHAHDIVRALLRDTADGPPYLFVFLIVLAAFYRRDRNVYRALEFSEHARWRNIVNGIVTDGDAAQFIRKLPMPIRYYGGGTNTVLGLYDANFSSPSFDGFNLNAEFLGDLGGGFATADISRATGREWVSLDVNSANPYDHDPDRLIIRHVTPAGRHALLDEDRRWAYIDEQAKIEYRKWSVLDGRPLSEVIGDRKSYSFVSTGFWTSTVRPIDPQRATDRHTYRDTSAMASLRLAELAATGRHVSLFTIERATSVHRRFKTCLMEWRDRKLVTMRLQPNQPSIPKRSGGYAFLLDQIDPSTPFFW
ncbi:hypothetical protein ACN22W_30020 [Burkholderia theae]|uniref:hypothetical protein n=1 Tax=Burkholderia theae TaxID=3143496 RepID=UPI003AFAA775